MINKKVIIKELEKIKNCIDDVNFIMSEDYWDWERQQESTFKETDGIYIKESLDRILKLIK